MYFKTKWQLIRAFDKLTVTVQNEFIKRDTCFLADFLDYLANVNEKSQTLSDRMMTYALRKFVYCLNILC